MRQGLARVFGTFAYTKVQEKYLQ